MIEALIISNMVTLLLLSTLLSWSFFYIKDIKNRCSSLIKKSKVNVEEVTKIKEEIFSTQEENNKTIKELQDKLTTIILTKR